MFTVWCSGGVEPPVATNAGAVKGLGDSLPASLRSEVCQIASVWEKLPSHIRTAILALLRGSVK